MEVVLGPLDSTVIIFFFKFGALQPVDGLELCGSHVGLMLKEVTCFVPGATRDRICFWPWLVGKGEPF